MDRLNAQEKLTIRKALNNVQKNKSYYDIVLKINQLLNINDVDYSCFVKFDEIEYIYNSLYQYTKTDCKYSLIKREYKYYFSSFDLPNDVVAEIENIYNNTIEKINSKEGRRIIRQGIKLDYYYKDRTRQVIYDCIFKSLERK